MIDGYAFSEGCTVDNGDKNYQINQLTDKGTACVETGDITNRYYGGENTDNAAITTTVNNAQGLLVLSAIINSGAGAGAVYSGYSDPSFGSFNGSRAYAGRTAQASGAYKFGNDSYGKVRNASYLYVGKPADAGNDFTASVNDDLKTPGRQNQVACGPLDAMTPGETEGSVNSPYLVKNYATWQTGYVCASKNAGMDLQFKSGTYDMSDYGTGFVGLSGRYYSNACASGNGADRDHIIPQVACINGNGAKIIFNSQVKQYVYDNYFLQSWGGLFNVAEYTNSYASGSVANNGGYVVQNLQLGDAETESNVSLTCIKSDGSIASYSDFKSDSSSAAKDNDTKVPHSGVGVLAGMTANHDSLANSGKYSNVAIVNCKVTGPSMAGGLYGNSGWASRRTDATKNRMADYDPDKTVSSPVKLYNCRYENLTVKGASRVGGFVGAVGGNGSSVEIKVASDSGGASVAEGSTINAQADGCIAGGFVGLAWSPVSVNASSDGAVDSSCKTANVKNVVVDNSYGVTNDSLSGTGGLIGNPKVSCTVANVNIDSDGSAANRSSAYVGSLNPSSSVKHVGGVVGQIDSCNVAKFQDVAVKNVRIGVNRAGAAVVGSLRGGKQITCDGVTVENAYVTGQWSGGIVGAINTDWSDSGNNNSSVTVSNSSICTTTFTGSDTGGVSGDGRGAFHLSNLLFKEDTFTGSQGVLVGIVNDDSIATQFRGLYATGVDIVPASGVATPAMIRSGGNTARAVNQKSFIAFADYNDVFKKVDGSSLYNDEGPTAAVNSASPWVTTNPVSSVKVKASSDAGADEKNLFGDGAAIETAATIKGEARTPIAGRYTYTNIGGCNDKGEYQNSNDYSASSKSTFNEQNTGNKVDEGKNFPVLVVPGSDEQTVKNYLNLVTNGGFSDAVRLNGSNGTYVTAKAETFALNKDKAFVKDSNQTPSLTVLNNGTADMSFRASSDWDNGKGRFTLLTVTFNDGSNHTYKVQVPIVVRRVLEINFAATFTYGTNYKSSNYSGLDSHVLTSFGDAMTGYLTWTYNKARGDNTEYGWNTHLESGGSMKPLGKTIDFSGDRGSLPQDTQLTLVDTAHNNKEYHYTVPAGGCKQVALTSFVDGNNQPYQEQWLSELMGVKATPNNNSGIWVKLGANDDKSNAGVKIGDDYYRVAASGEAGDRYDLSVDAETSPSENFYLVVRVPKGSTASYVEGYAATSVSSDVNTNINYVKRKNEDEFDNHENTARTYCIAQSYSQVLSDNVSGQHQLSEEGTSSWNMNVNDEITVGANEFNDADSLFYKLDSSLVKYKNGNVDSATGYPKGTTIAYKFYVEQNGHYYKWENSAWQDVGAEAVPATDGATWNADGNEMSLVLADGDGKAIDLKYIRKIAKQAGRNSIINIRMEAVVTMTGPACRESIMASPSDTQLSAYTQPSYRSTLSMHTEEGSDGKKPSTSTMTADSWGRAQYYRKGTGSSSIALIATQKTQLGINVSDLTKADGTIALAGTYDLSNLSGAKKKLEDATTVTYKLSLQKKDDKGDYADVSEGISSYITVDEDLHSGVVKSKSTNAYVFTDQKESGKFATRDGDSLALKPHFMVKVNTNVTDFANYRLVLTAHMEGGGVDDTPTNAMGYGEGYANSDFVTYTLTKVNTKGVDH